ncbi:hypothetical protein FXW78_18270 [Rhodococcus opacus]|nr:hypothetical protein [Rhodococcus opacus]
MGAPTRQDAEDLLFREARLLDEGLLDDWLDMLSADTQYLVPLTTSDDDVLSIISEDRFRIEARVWRITQTGLSHSQDPPSRTTRTVTNVEVVPGPGSETTIHSVVVLHEWRPGGQRDTGPVRIFPFRVEHRLRWEEDKWLITFRKLTMLQRDGALPPMTYMI